MKRFGKFYLLSHHIAATVLLPHIVSVAPIRSIVLLRNCGDREGSKATSTANVQLAEQQVQDLERYIDATRGEIFFARGVILVEGDAELYVIPTFADALGFPLDQRGISVCSVQGTDFSPYVRLLGEGSLNIPFVVITDGDEKRKCDGDISYLGRKRGIDLATLERADYRSELDGFFDRRDWGSLHGKLNELGFYVGVRTLEIDIAIGNSSKLVITFKELGAGVRQLNNIEQALSDTENLSEDTISYILNRVEEYGKGRFAQRLAPKLKDENIPEYIKQAIEHIVRLVQTAK